MKVCYTITSLLINKNKKLLIIEVFLLYINISGMYTIYHKEESASRVTCNSLLITSTSSILHNKNLSGISLAVEYLT